MAVETRSASQVVKIFKDDPERLKQLTTANDPKQGLKLLQDAADQAVTDIPAYIGDHVVYRIVVSMLGTIAILVVAGSFWVVLNRFQVPDILVNLGTAAVGALAGLFAPSAVHK